MKSKKITIVGCGYVGASMAYLFAKKHEVTILEIDQKKINKINNSISPIQDKEIDKLLKKNKFSIKATKNSKEAFSNKDIILICTPTDYEEKTGKFNTKSVTKTIKEINRINNKALIVIKSTVQVGFTEKISKKYNKLKIIFSPEFLREDSALKDNLYPSRIIIGGTDKDSKSFGSMLQSLAIKKNTSVEFTSPSEAEAIKLFSNSFLAMRVAFFNELDSFALGNNLKTEKIIKGVSLDPRIGMHYNNPSFGYGGYCLPKDTKQLLENYKKIPQKIIEAIVSSNSSRKDFISDEILKTKKNVVGIYRLVMKEGSNNFRSSAIQGIVKRIQKNGLKVLIYEPLLNSKTFLDSEVINNLGEFKEKSEIILANRFSKNLIDVESKVFSRDIYNSN